MMFNEKIKKQYIQKKEQEVVIDPYMLNNRFTEIGTYERELNKDCSSFSAYEIIDYYKSLNLKSYESLSVANCIYSQYTDWCIKNSLVEDNQNHYKELTVDLLRECVSEVKIQQSIISRRELLSLLVTLPNFRDQYMLLAIFEFGKSKNFHDLVYLKPEDVNHDDCSLQLDDRKVPISRELMGIIDDCSTETDYEPFINSAQRRLPLYDFGYVLKECAENCDMDDEFKRGKRTYRSVVRALSNCGIYDWVKPGDILNSGIIHMILTRSKELQISPEEYIHNHNHEIKKQYGLNSFARVKFVRKYGKYINSMLT